MLQHVWAAPACGWFSHVTLGFLARVKPTFQKQFAIIADSVNYHMAESIPACGTSIFVGKFNLRKCSSLSIRWYQKYNVYDHLGPMAK